MRIPFEIQEMIISHLPIRDVELLCVCSDWYDYFMGKPFTIREVVRLGTSEQIAKYYTQYCTSELLQYFITQVVKYSPIENLLQNLIAMEEHDIWSYVEFTRSGMDAIAMYMREHHYNIFKVKIRHAHCAIGVELSKIFVSQGVMDDPNHILVHLETYFDLMANDCEDIVEWLRPKYLDIFPYGARKVPDRFHNHPSYILITQGCEHVSYEDLKVVELRIIARFWNSLVAIHGETKMLEAASRAPRSNNIPLVISHPDELDFYFTAQFNPGIWGSKSIPIWEWSDISKIIDHPLLVESIKIYIYGNSINVDCIRNLIFQLPKHMVAELSISNGIIFGAYDNTIKYAIIIKKINGTKHEYNPRIISYREVIENIRESYTIWDIDRI